MAREQPAESARESHEESYEARVQVWETNEWERGHARARLARCTTCSNLPAPTPIVGWRIGDARHARIRIGMSQMSQVARAPLPCGAKHGRRGERIDLDGEASDERLRRSLERREGRVRRVEAIEWRSQANGHCGVPASAQEEAHARLRRA